MSEPTDPEQLVLVVWHPGGSLVYETNSFHIDDKSSTLLVYADDTQRRAIAAFNREFWIHADLIERRNLEQVRSPGPAAKGGDDGGKEVRAEV